MTSQTDPKTIILTGDYACQQEAEATATITPGDLIERNGNGVRPHASAGGNANAHFAKEYDKTGRSISDDYSSGDVVEFATVPAGYHVYALLKDGQNVSKFAFLTSNGDGTLKAATTGDIIIAQALEAVNASGSDERIIVEVVTPQTSA